MTPGQARKQEWLAACPRCGPTWLVNTGDNLAHAASVPVVRDALGALLDAPGVFVFGSNDYFSPTLRNPLALPAPDDGRRKVSSPGCRGPSCATRSPRPAGWT
jgi:predicted MPP superfamily phosphohydrolase